MEMKIRVAACQIDTYPDTHESSGKIVEWINRASEEEVDVVAFPEASLCGYPCEPSYWEKADPEDFRVAEEAVTEVSRKRGIGVVLGTAHRDGGRWFNDILAIDKGGKIRGRYSKTHLAESWPSPGKVLPIYDLAGAKSCFLVCHDIRYPELVRLPAISGAQVCYFCSNESGILSEHKLSAYRAMPIARATENGIFVVMANAPANPDDVRSGSQSHGNSKIIHPDGNVLEEAGFFEEVLVTQLIDLDDANRAVAMRAANDDTILKRWMNQGTELVSRGGEDA
jgi:predicted amidohydrolase